MIFILERYIISHMELEAKLGQAATDFEKRIFSGSKKATQERYKFLAEHIFSNDNVLDIGVNSGTQLSVLAKRAKKITGIDHGKLEFQIAAHNNRHLKNVAIQQMNAESLDFPDNTFNVVSSFECIEHVQDPEKMLSEIARVLKPKGTVIISTPNRDVSGFRFLSKEHIREWDYQGFADLLGQFFSTAKWYGQKITKGTPRQKLFTNIRSSFAYGFYERMPRGTRSFTSNIFQTATLGDSWEVKPLNLSANEKSLTSIAVLTNPKRLSSFG